MELQEFITSTLESISKGLQDANKNLSGSNNYRLAFGKDGEITFDIALTVSETSDKSAGGGIKVYALSIGGEKGKSNLQENVSRIKFKIQPGKTIS